ARRNLQRHRRHRPARLVSLPLSRVSLACRGESGRIGTGGTRAPHRRETRAQPEGNGIRTRARALVRDSGLVNRVRAFTEGGISSALGRGMTPRKTPIFVGNLITLTLVACGPTPPGESIGETSSTLRTGPTLTVSPNTVQAGSTTITRPTVTGTGFKQGAD